MRSLQARTKRRSFLLTLRPLEDLGIKDPFPEEKKDPTVVEQKVRVLPAYFPTCDWSGFIFLTNPGST